MDRLSEKSRFESLTYRPYNVFSGIEVLLEASKTTGTSAIRRKPRHPIGSLDLLPLELIHLILESLDARSFSRFMRVSLRGKEVAESLPAYKDIIRAVDPLFSMLGLSKLAHIHSMASIHATLCSDRCVSCKRYGAFVTLLTLERCCYACLYNNRSLWVISRRQASDYFFLSNKELKTIPQMRAIPGEYGLNHRTKLRRPTKLLSVRAVKELAIVVHGSMDAVAKKAAKRDADPHSYYHETARYLHKTPLSPLSQPFRSLPCYSEWESNKFAGVGAIPFPSISGAEVEHGPWCRRCTMASQDSIRNNQPTITGPFDDIVQYAQLSSDRSEPKYRARSKAEFLEHAEECQHAAKVVKVLGKDLRGWPYTRRLEFHA